MSETPVLRPSDGLNLANDRTLCPDCTGTRSMIAMCDRCDDNGTVIVDTGREALSATRLSAKLRCSRLFELSYRESLEPIETPVPLEVGRAFAHALQHNDPVAGAAYLMDHAVIGSPEDDDKAVTNAAIVHAGARYYLDRWGTTEGREFEYRVRLRSPYTGAPSLTFDLTGRIDALVDKGDHWLMVEDKLLAQVTPLTIAQLKLDRQISLGCYGVWRATGKPVREILYRIVRKPSIKQKQTETIADYITRLHADYSDPARQDFYGTQQRLFRSDEDLLLTECELWAWAEEIRQADRSRIFPRNTTACLQFGSGCRMLPICLGDPDAMSLYRRKPGRTGT